MRHFLAALLAAGLLGVSPAAHAHAGLVASEPADGARLDAAPSELVLRFDESVTPLALRVNGPAASEIALPPPSSVLRATLPAGLGEGIHVVSWRVVSADGHPVSGAFAFGVGRAVVPAATVADTSRAATWSVALMGLRYAFYLTFALAAGGALFRLLVTEPPCRVRRGIAAAAVLGIGVAALGIGCLGGLLAEAPLGALLLTGTWRLGAGSPFAISLGVSAAGLALCGAAALRAVPAARWLGAAGAVVAALGFPLAGHAATAEPRWLAAAALTTHALAAALWLGAFWPLLALLADRGGDALAEVERFSRRALLGVAALLAAGIILAALRLPSPAALAGSDYGRLVLAKTAGFVILLALAAWNRQRLTPALAAGRSLAGRALSRSILAEIGIAALVLGVTTVLVRTPPPGETHDHAHHAPVRRDIAIATELGGRSALLILAPGQVGANRIALWLGSSPPAEVWAELEQPALGLGPLRRRLQPDGQGWYAYTGSELAAPGRWTIRLELLVSDFEQVTGEVSADLLPPGRR